MAKGSKPKAAAKPPKEKKPKPAKAAVGHNSAGTDGATNTDEQNRALFLYHLADTRNKSNIVAMKKALETANANLRNAYKAAKADGFDKKDFEIAFDIQRADGEKRRKELIQRNLQIAGWLGCDLGAQLDLFSAQTTTGVPAEDRAFEEGKTASYEGKVASPPYDPSLVQHRRWLEGWHEATETRVKSGIAKLHPEVAASEKAAADKKDKIEGQKAQDAKAFDPPASGVAMTRAEFKKAQEAKGVAGDTAH